MPLQRTSTPLSQVRLGLTCLALASVFLLPFLTATLAAPVYSSSIQGWGQDASSSAAEQTLQIAGAINLCETFRKECIAYVVNQKLEPQVECSSHGEVASTIHASCTGRSEAWRWANPVTSVDFTTLICAKVGGDGATPQSTAPLHLLADEPRLSLSDMIFGRQAAPSFLARFWKRTAAASSESVEYLRLTSRRAFGFGFGSSISAASSVHSSSGSSSGGKSSSSTGSSSSGGSSSKGTSSSGSDGTSSTPSTGTRGTGSILYPGLGSGANSNSSSSPATRLSTSGFLVLFVAIPLLSVSV